MIEPSYEQATPEGRARMERLGYARDLPGTLQRLGHAASTLEPWPLNANPLNPAALIIVKKSEVASDTIPQFISPISGRNLIRRSRLLVLSR